MENLRKVLAFILVLSLLFLSSCGTVQPPDTTLPGDDDDIGGGGGDKPGDEGIEFTVNVFFNGRYVTLAELSGNPEAKFSARWTDEYSYHEAEFDETGVARVKGLDGDYHVTLSGLPSGYSYNPNIHIATNDKPHVTVEVYRINTTTYKGKTLYHQPNDRNSCIDIDTVGMYSVTLTDENDVVYFQFTPRESGKYTVESWVDAAANTVNPSVDIYNGTTAYKNFAFNLDDGGYEGSFTKNFSHDVSISIEEVGNTFSFAVRASTTVSTGEPIVINFAIMINGSLYSNAKESQLMVPLELLSYVYGKLEALKTMDTAALASELGISESKAASVAEKLAKVTFPTYDEEKGLYSDTHKVLYSILMGMNIKGDDDSMFRLSEVESYLKGLFNATGTYKYAESEMIGAEGRKLFDQNMYKLCPEDGFYHLYDPVTYASTGGYGPILYADITTGGRFLNAGLNDIEYAGNKALTVDYTKNYKHFIEGYLSLITPRGGYPNITFAYYCSYGGEDPRIVGNCPCVAEGCDRACYAGCETCTDQCRNIPFNLDYAPGYADFANSEGRVPVTEEMKLFLQSFSVSQRYFADGNGWVETNPTYAVDAPEDSQWLWACGYYLP